MSKNTFTEMPRRYRATNPATGQQLAQEFVDATETEVAAACNAAASAFATYGKKNGADKAALLEAIATEIMNLGNALIEMAHEETGLPIARLQGERTRTVNQLCLFADIVREGSWVNAIIDKGDPTRQPLPKPDIRQMQIPLGPIAVFGASNFPLAFSVAGGDTASALAAGCTVVFKAHPAHPGTCQLVAAAIQKAVLEQGMPDGIFNMVHGLSHQVGSWLVQNPRIRAVAFTGSYTGGKALYDLAARRPEPIPVYAEMGSVNPIFFLPGALRQKGETLAKEFAASITLGTGQFCTNPGVFVMVKDDAAKAFVQYLKDSISAAVVGPMLTDGIRQQYLKGVQKLAENPAVNAVTTFITEQVRPQLFTTDSSSVQENNHLTEEVFGPCSMGIYADSIEDMVAFAQNLQGQLTATIHSIDEDVPNVVNLLETLQQKAGRIIFNGFPTGVEVTHAMVHGGPFPATTNSQSTSVGTHAIYRFTRPVCFQDFPEQLLPPELMNANPANISRKVNGSFETVTA